MRIYLRGRNDDGTRSAELKDITAICSNVHMEGHVKGASRSVTLSVLRNEEDYFLGKLGSLQRGDMIQLKDAGEDGAEYFRGIVWEIDEDDGEKLKTVKCYDNIKFMMQSDALTCVFTDVTPVEVTKTVAKEMGLTVGNICECDTKVSVNGRGKKGYEIIMIAWTEASKLNFKKYHCRMVNGKLDVIEKGQLLEGKVLKYQSTPAPCNLINVKKRESSDDAITAVYERTEDGAIKFVKSDKDLVNLLGYIVGVNDATKQGGEAKEINNGSTTCEVDAIGDWAVQTGYSIIIQSKLLSAKFYIEDDEHVFDNGVHTMHLVLSYENSMDEHSGDSNANEEVSYEETVTGDLVKMECTGYCPCVICCGKTDGITASGKVATPNHTVAAAAKYKFGTKMYIPYFKDAPNGGNFVVEDRGGAIQGNKIDIFFQTHQEALNFGRRTLDVYVNGSRSVKKVVTVTKPEAGGGFIGAEGDGIYHGSVGWPFAGGAGTVTQGFGGGHRGWDISTRGGGGAGSPVLAVEGGVVVGAGWQLDDWSYGNAVTIQHTSGLCTRYAHLSSVNVRAGQKVSKGQQIGVEGNTGNSNGTHLHIEFLSSLPWGALYNPGNYLRRYG